MTATLTIATDGSAAWPCHAGTARGRHAGWGWVSDTGRYRAGRTTHRSVLLAEVTAIDNALAWALNESGNHQSVQILSDSQSALELIQRLRQDDTLVLRARADAREQIAVKTASIVARIRRHGHVDVELGWVRGHVGHPLNHAADRIARHARVAIHEPDHARTAYYERLARAAGTAHALAC